MVHGTRGHMFELPLTDIAAGPEMTSFDRPTTPTESLSSSHLRWKFVWQRPQQFLSRFAKNHPVLFVELTDFDLKDNDEPMLELETVAENVTVANIHLPSKMVGAEEVNDLMRHYCAIAIDAVNHDSAFNDPLLWFYSPMDAGWALGHVNGRGIVYDCMDELSQFRGAPPEMIQRGRRC